MRPWIRASAVVGAALAAGAVAFLALRRPAGPPHREGDGEHSGPAREVRPIAPPPLPADLLRKLVDPGSTADVPVVRLAGTLERPDIPSPGPRLEETATWPDRWERRIVLSGDVAWVRLEGGRISRSLHTGVPGVDLSPEEGWLRLRAAFCLRHLASAARIGTSPARFDLRGEPLGAVSLSDGGGAFRLLAGGVAGGLRGIEGRGGLVLFTAHLRTGHWIYPAAQALVKDGRIVEIVRVVSTLSTAGG